MTMYISDLPGYRLTKLPLLIWTFFICTDIICGQLSSVTGNVPLENDRTIGSTGYLSCSYEPTSYIWNFVSWDYKASPSDIQLYGYDNFQDVSINKDNRYNHTHTDGKFTLIIYNLTANDAGTYICNINTGTANVQLNPFSPGRITTTDSGGNPAGSSEPSTTARVIIEDVCLYGVGFCVGLAFAGVFVITACVVGALFCYLRCLGAAKLCADFVKKFNNKTRKSIGKQCFLITVPPTIARATIWIISNEGGVKAHVKDPLGHSTNCISVTIPKGTMKHILDGSVKEEELDKVLPERDKAPHQALRQILKSVQHNSA